LTAVDILPVAESWPGSKANNFTGVAMTKKYKRSHKKIEDRPWSSIEAHDKAQRELDIEGWKKNSELLADDAFADDVPDDLDRDGYISRSVTHVPSKSVLEE